MEDGSDPAPPSESRAGRTPGFLVPDYLYAQAAPPPPATPRPPGTFRQPHVPQPLDLSPSGLRPYETKTEVTFFSTSGLITYPNALLSPDWTQSGIPAVVAEALGHPIEPLPPNHARRICTPRGRLRCSRGLPLWFTLKNLPLPPVLVLLPVLETEIVGNLGVSLVLGNPFIEQCFGHNWPPLNVQGQAGSADTTLRVTALEDVPNVALGPIDLAMSMTTTSPTTFFTPTFSPVGPLTTTFPQLLPTTNYYPVSTSPMTQLATPFSHDEWVNRWLPDTYPYQQEE